jgi:ABC-type branched-subunit amino acid transport system substrate-binding protein
VASGCASAALAVAVAGCAAASNSSVTVSGKTLTIYASVPAHTDNPAQTQDVLDAERLALKQTGTQVGTFTVKLVPLQGENTQIRQVADNARTAIQDKTAIAYLGEADPGGSANSIPITNAQGILQVSPTDTALEYTQATLAVPSAPSKFYTQGSSSYGETFARVVPSSELEAAAQVQEMQSLHVTKLYVADDGSEYGAAVALAVRRKASALNVVAGTADAAKVGSSGADAVFFGAADPARAASFLGQVAAAGPNLKLFGPSALDNQTFAGALTPAAQPNVYISAPGFMPAELTPAGSNFVSAFTAAYGRPPLPGAIFGYEAMAAVLAVLKQAGASANDRSVVVHDFFQFKSSSSSVLPTYSIHNGDATFAGGAPFVFSHFKAGKLVPFKFVQAQG